MGKLFSVRKRILLGSLLLAMTLVWTGFIFMNSMESGEESSAKSGKVVETVEKAASAVGVEITDRDALIRGIRKSAHFTEFGLLGLLCFLTVTAYRLKPVPFSVLPIGYCLAAAVADEYIQTFTDGRVGQASDVLIDILGAGFVILICLAFTRLADIRSSKRKKSV